jgi:hypothetical protein
MFPTQYANIRQPVFLLPDSTAIRHYQCLKQFYFRDLRGRVNHCADPQEFRPSSISRPPAQSISTSTISALIISPAANLTAPTKILIANSTVTSQNGITGAAITEIVIGIITAIALVTIATLLLFRYRKTSALFNKPEVAAFPVMAELRSGEHANRHET